MFNKVNGIGLFGLNAFPVTAEISMTAGMPRFDIVGLPDLAVQESKLRIKSALENSKIPMKQCSLTVNLTPASVKKTGSLFDLTILLGIVFATLEPDIDISKSVFVGEVSLSGELMPINGALTMAISAAESGMKEIFFPYDNAKEASVVEGINVYGVKSVTELLSHLMKKEVLSPEKKYTPNDNEVESYLDFADVKGQESAKRALEVAAAGFHNVLMIGTPGTGKSMLAKRLPSILPPMSFRESIDTTQIYSVAGMLDLKNPLMTKRPFRAVSHTASASGLIGGGSIPKPGEISLSHNGVLFLDELPEFDRRTLETLRQPLEDGVVHISRSAGKASYPCNVMLVAAMNPCPCGNFGHETKPCTCNSKVIGNYLGRISGPVLDRIDIQVEVAAVDFSEISNRNKSEESKFILERVLKAREIQKDRYKGTNITSNSGITSDILHEVCELDEAAQSAIKAAFDKLGLSARAYDRILKVSRTIADLEGERIIGRRHIAGAIQYRSLDKKYWNR